jgi:transcriptional regulator with XRE-family HTH domain
MITLKQAREQRFMSQRDLAAAAGVIPRTINALENGQRVPTWRVINKISTALGVAPGFIVWNKPDVVTLPRPVAVTQSPKSLEDRIAWLELAVKDLAANGNETLKHVIALERKAGMGTEVTLIQPDKISVASLPADSK